MGQTLVALQCIKCILVSENYLVLHDLSCRKNTLMDLSACDGST